MTSRSSATSFAAAVPLAATEAYGLGPFSPGGGTPPARVRPQDLRPSPDTLITAVDTCGLLGRQLLSVLTWAGGALTADQMATETEGAKPDELTSVIDRLVAAGLVARTSTGGTGVRVTPALAELLPSGGASLSDPNAMTADGLSLMCQRLGLTVPKRKQERIDAMAAAFDDPDRRAAIRSTLSAPAMEMVEAIAERGGPYGVRASALGLDSFELHLATPSRHAFQVRRESSEATALKELTHRGIVGVDPYEDELWIWREAWPLLERPLYRSWPSVDEPGTALVTGAAQALPPLVTTVERALQHWDQSPPPVLKNGESRFSKTVVRATAKALSVDEATVELISRVVLSLGLLLPNVIRSSGRGRQRTVDQVWRADPDLRAAWSASPAVSRWLRIVAEWANPGEDEVAPLVANRHLLLWEMAALTPGVGWIDDSAIGAWCEHRYWPVGDAEAVVESLRDLRTLGVIRADSPAALTELGRMALSDPAAVAHADLGSAREAVVQADHTVVCPPDLDSDLMVRLGELATLESDAGARIFRLDERSITASVQGGDSASSITEFLEALSSVPLADTVRQLVDDAAAQADRVRVLAATTVVVTTDPADLALACKQKAAKLTAVTATVGVSSVAPEKVRQALQRKGLAPLLVAAEGAAPARRSADDVDRLEQAARHRRDLAQRYDDEHLAAEARRFEQAATAGRDPSSKLAVTGPIAVTPELLGITIDSMVLA